MTDSSLYKTSLWLSSWLEENTTFKKDWNGILCSTAGSQMFLLIGHFSLLRVVLPGTDPSYWFHSTENLNNQFTRLKWNNQIFQLEWNDKLFRWSGITKWIVYLFICCCYLARGRPWCWGSRCQSRRWGSSVPAPAWGSPRPRCRCKVQRCVCSHSSMPGPCMRSSATRAGSTPRGLPLGTLSPPRQQSLSRLDS